MLKQRWESAGSKGRGVLDGLVSYYSLIIWVLDHLKTVTTVSTHKTEQATLKTSGSQAKTEQSSTEQSRTSLLTQGSTGLVLVCADIIPEETEREREREKERERGQWDARGTSFRLQPQKQDQSSSDLPTATKPTHLLRTSYTTPEVWRKIKPDTSPSLPVHDFTISAYLSGVFTYTPPYLEGSTR